MTGGCLPGIHGGYPKHLFSLPPSLSWKVKFTTTVRFQPGLSTNRDSWVGPRSGQAAQDQNLKIQKWKLGDFGRQATQAGSTKEKNVWGTPSNETAAVGVVAHTCSLSTWEAEARSLISRPAWSTKRVPGQLALHRKSVSRKTKR